MVKPPPGHIFYSTSTTTNSTGESVSPDVRPMPHSMRVTRELVRGGPVDDPLDIDSLPNSVPVLVRSDAIIELPRNRSRSRSRRSSSRSRSRSSSRSRSRSRRSRRRL